MPKHLPHLLRGCPLPALLTYRWALAGEFWGGEVGEGRIRRWQGWGRPDPEATRSGLAESGGDGLQRASLGWCSVEETSWITSLLEEEDRKSVV